jgi:uncharacterized RDD family membrane protein YckC
MADIRSRHVAATAVRNVDLGHAAKDGEADPISFQRLGEIALRSLMTSCGYAIIAEKQDGRTAMTDQSLSQRPRSDPPGRLWYFVALFVALAAIAGAALLAYSAADRIGRGLVQVLVPGEATLNLKAGRYTIFHEYESVDVYGRVYSGTDVSGLLVNLVPLFEGAPIKLERPSSPFHLSYYLQGRSGQPVLTFEAQQPGAYRLIAAYPEGREKSEAVLAVGPGLTGGIGPLVLRVFGIGLGGLIVGLVIGAVTLARRREALAANAPLSAESIQRVQVGAGPTSYAGLGLRALATILDTVILIFLLFFLGYMVEGANGEGFNLVGVPGLVVLGLGFAYYIILEAIFGATLGKIVFGLKVLREDGSSISWGASAVRNLLRIVDGLFFYLVGFIIAMQSPKRQRLGDLMAKTAVVSKGSVS